MKYSQLDTKAKERARAAWREASYHDEWWDHVYDDAATVGARLGIHIGTNVTRTVKGVHVEKPDINFEGFYTQGCYASFGGVLHVEQLNECAARVQEYASLSEELLALTEQGQKIYDMIVAHHVKNRLDEDVDDLHAPECTPTMKIFITNRSGQTSVIDEDLATEVSDEVDKYVRDFADWIYLQLEAEYDHIESDEYTIESIEANEPDFDEDGNLE